MNLYMRLLRYVKPYIYVLALGFVCIAMVALSNLYVPWIIKNVIDDVLTAKNMAMLNTIGLGIVVVFFLRSFFFYGQNYLMAYAGQRIVNDLREAVFRQLQRLPLSYYDRRQTGAIMSYITNDVAAVQNAVAQNIVDLGVEAITLLGSIGAMFYIHWKLTLLTFATIPFVAHATNVIGRKMRSASGVQQEKAASLITVLQETISSTRVIKSFVREDYEIGRFNKENLNNLKAQMKTVQLNALLLPLTDLLAAVGVTVIVWYGGLEVINGNLTSGDMMAILIYAVNLSNPIRRISGVYGNIQKALAAAERVFSVLDIDPGIVDLPEAKSLPAISGTVTFDHVNFEYKPGEPALCDLNFEAKPGQMIGIVGPSGAGKSTIANLVPRFYEPQAGKILIDGIDIRQVTMNSLRSQIGIVPQETFLFNGSIRDNIRYGRLDATDEEIIEAAKAANAHSFILEMPAGYETNVGERGGTLSGGQRQRIAIARAILKDPRILILDEATSALDPESEKLVQEALDKLMVGRTSFVIAHRLSTVQRADVLLVLERGCVVEVGRHDELVAAGGLYSKLYQMQYSEVNGQPA